MIAPPFVEIAPVGAFGVTCRPNTASTCGSSSTPSSIMNQRAVEALLAGLEHEAHGAGEVVAARASTRAAPANIATCASWPHACIVPSTSLGVVEAGVFGHRQRVHVAAEQDRRAGTRVPSRSATTDVSAVPVRTREREIGKRVEHRLLRARELQTELGMLVDAAP